MVEYQLLSCRKTKDFSWNLKTLADRRNFNLIGCPGNRKCPSWLGLNSSVRLNFTGLLPGNVPTGCSNREQTQFNSIQLKSVAVLPTRVWRVGRINWQIFEKCTLPTHSLRGNPKSSEAAPIQKKKKKIKLVMHKRRVCASEQAVLGAFLIHSRVKTWSLLSKWSTLSSSSPPFTFK